RRRRQRELKAGLQPAPERHLNLTYPYFILCLFSAGVHPNEGRMTFFWGQSILIVGALLPFRSRRFGIFIWPSTVLVAIGIGFASQSGVRALHGIFQTLDARLIARLFQQRTDPTQAITSIGDIGELKLSGRIVLRVWPKDHESPPTYLREASYRDYKETRLDNKTPRETWFSGTPRNEFTGVFEETNQTSWLLLPSKTNTASVKIAAYLTSRSIQTGNAEGLLPLPMDSGR